MTQTIKERLELLKQWEDPDVKGMKYTQYKTDPVLTPLIFNAGVDACLPLLEEVLREELEAIMRVDIGSIDATRVALHQRLEALTDTK